ncbi:MAG TPA: hypothetical protein VKR54_03070 [Candidatus Babeliales bacterium]|jgi:hypothetical protein|nr:hypothetical protein [Candidatus Babeliales bacterium]
MLKKTLLSALLTVSTLATAQINLDLEVTVTNDVTEHRAAGIVLVDENVTTPIVFDGLDALIVGINAQTNGEVVLLQTQFFQRTEESDELIPATELFAVQVPFKQAATITVNDADNNGSLVLTITPTLAE